MFKSIRLGSPRSPLMVYGAYAGRSALTGIAGLTADERGRLKAALDTPGFAAEPGEIAHAGDGAIVVGLGERPALTTAILRQVGARLVAALDRMAPRSVRLRLPSIASRVGDEHAIGRGLAEGVAMANWRVDLFDGAATKRTVRRGTLTIGVETRGLRDGVEEGLEIAACANEARRIAATPPNICNPAWIASEARRLARGTGLSCRVVTYADAQRLGMNGLVNVGRGSDVKPRMVVLEYKPARARRGVRLALVGKTMTYDTGGYSLKLSGSMRGMKYDGNGGCAVLGTMLAIARLKLPVHVVGLLPTAENMVSGDAYRPDDIITMYNGVSVEVTNTDAEGRLILGDALAYACKQFRPTAVIDVATLTGGVVVALGSWCAGLFCADDDLRARLEDAAESTGERVWPLPLWDEHRDFMRAKHADIWNSGPKRDGHPIQGAAFLSFFVDESIPWAHIDIAGVSDASSDTDMFVQGPTGFGVRLLTETVRGYAD